ncbi:hypothetical protein L195_g023287 [Trifolium pratense]|uniref:Uncharacterized protein n=1 Tax=Trifolium pratense TaxID=57577 RepID=A0A2K3NAE4_TRIPR|nr:hypothetical protein L195_g023287 [Trifolium pratense]
MVEEPRLTSLPGQGGKSTTPSSIFPSAVPVDDLVDPGPEPVD